MVFGKSKLSQKSEELVKFEKFVLTTALIVVGRFQVKASTEEVDEKIKIIKNKVKTNK